MVAGVEISDICDDLEALPALSELEESAIPGSEDVQLNAPEVPVAAPGDSSFGDFEIKDSDLLISNPEDAEDFGVETSEVGDCEGDR